MNQLTGPRPLARGPFGRPVPRPVRPPPSLSGPSPPPTSHSTPATPTQPPPGYSSHFLPSNHSPLPPTPPPRSVHPAPTPRSHGPPSRAAVRVAPVVLAATVVRVALAVRVAPVVLAAPVVRSRWWCGCAGSTPLAVLAALPAVRRSPTMGPQPGRLGRAARLRRGQRFQNGLEAGFGVVPVPKSVRTWRAVDHFSSREAGPSSSVTRSRSGVNSSVVSGVSRTVRRLDRSSSRSRRS